MTYTTKAGGQQSPSFLFPELSSQAKRSSDTTLSLFADAPAMAELTSPMITTVLATTKALPPLPAGAARESLEPSYLAQSSQAADFQKGVALFSAPAVAMNSHQVLSDSLPGAATAMGSTSMGSTSMAPSCGCRACSVLAVSTDGAAAWDTATDQAPLVMNSLVTLGTGVNLSSVFQLHSNPTATKTIFLDFDGYAINNSIWENGGNLSLKGFYNNFDSGALTEIQRIWQRVAEDFSPFNVNVTTQDPGSENLRKFGTGDDRWGIRVAFTSNLNLLTGKAIINAGGGGTAYYNSFNWSTDEVALVFNRGEYAATSTASHEVGHTLGLRHDGAGTTEYYGGHGGTGPTSWGTIMGSAWMGDDENLTQWSKGEYTGANNTQDDLALITNGSNYFTYAADDHGNSFTSATTLDGLSFSSFGVIERNTDIDMFRFDTGAGLVSFNIVNASRAFINSGGTYTTEYLTARGANLDIAASLFRADGSLVQTFNPADLTTASFSINLDAGSYYLGIDGVGFGNPTASTPTGYTDYGSLGQYMVSGTVQPNGTTPPSTTNTTSTLQVLDPNGSVKLLRDTSTDLISVQINGVTSAVRRSGSQIKASQFSGWQILAAETVGTNQNQILWKETSTGRLHFWSVDSGWNFVSGGAIVSPTSSTGLLLQQQFSVDANGTPLPTTPPPPTIPTTTPPPTTNTTSTLQVLDPNGSVKLLRDTSTDLISVQINGVTSAVRRSGSQIKASQFSGWQILAAETVGTNQNQILWKETSTGRLHFWSVDSGWNFVSGGAIVSPTSSTGLLLQQQFSVDANGTPLPTTPPPPTIPTTNTTSTLQVLDPNGAVQLLRDTSTDLVSVRINGVTSAVRKGGTQIKASQFGGWQILAAETVGTNQNQILWKETSTGRLHFWSVDSSWNYVSGGAIVTPTSSTGLLLQQQFMVDATGTPLSPTVQKASLEAVDPIIGGGTSLAPDATDAFAYDQTPLDSVLPEDLTFSTEPFLALTELASLGAANPTGTEPLVAPFPAAGLDTSATSPWLVATQPLL